MDNFLTIAICTYNRAHILSHCLNSLLNQSIPSIKYSVFIIDNNSTDDTQEIAEQFKNKFYDFHIFFEKQQGLSYARNRALHECQTKWIAFLDDDAKAHPDWVSTILTTITKNDFDAFGGPYYAWHLYGPAPRWLPEDFGTYESTQGYGPLEGDTYIPGGNSAIRCAAARAIGTFSPELGMNGGYCGYGEETQFFERMRTAGYRAGYVPQLKIDHCVLSYKYTLRWQIRSYFEYGKSAVKIGVPIKKFFPLRFLFHCGRSLLTIITYFFSLKKNEYIGRVIFKNLCPLIWDIGVLYERYITQILRIFS